MKRHNKFLVFLACVVGIIVALVSYADAKVQKHRQARHKTSISSTQHTGPKLGIITPKPAKLRGISKHRRNRK